MTTQIDLKVWKTLATAFVAASLLAGCAVYEAPPPPPRYAYYHPHPYYAPAPVYGSVVVGARWR
jgi:hypothetical protein